MSKELKCRECGRMTKQGSSCYWCGEKHPHFIQPGEYVKDIKIPIHTDIPDQNFNIFPSKSDLKYIIDAKEAALELTQKHLGISMGCKVKHTIDRPEPATIKAEGEMNNIEVDLNGRNGLRINWYDSYRSKVEIKDENGNWVQIAGLQHITIEMDAKNPLPLVKMQAIMLPETKEHALLQKGIKNESTPDGQSDCGESGEKD